MPIVGKEDDTNLRFLAGQLALGLEETKKIVKNLETTLNEKSFNLEIKYERNKVEWDHLKADIGNMKNSIDSLYKLIRGDDHGSNSLIGRIQSMENKHEDFKEFVDKYEDKEKTEQKESSVLKAEDKRGKYALIVASITGVLTLGMTILNLVFHK
jgi:hypothetical protein